MRLALLIALLPTIASAHNVRCGPEPAIMQSLARQYGETMQAVGLSSSGRIMRLLANPDSGTWTVLSVGTDGQACLIDAGEWMELAPADAAPMGEDG